MNIIDTIFPILVVCSIFLVMSLVNWARYLFLKRKLQFIYEEYKEEIHKAIRCNKIKFSALFKEPLETGNDMLDLLLFKTHRSALFFVTPLFVYVISVISLYLFLRLLQSLIGWK